MQAGPDTLGACPPLGRTSGSPQAAQITLESVAGWFGGIEELLNVCDLGACAIRGCQSATFHTLMPATPPTASEPASCWLVYVDTQRGFHYIAYWYDLKMLRILRDSRARRTSHAQTLMSKSREQKCANDQCDNPLFTNLLTSLRVDGSCYMHCIIAHRSISSETQLGSRVMIPLGVVVNFHRFAQRWWSV